MSLEEVLPRLRALSNAYDGLRLLVLYGSRARREAHELSDWDIGYLAAGPLDYFRLLDELTHILHTDRIDLVDLDRASGLLRFQVAREGVVLYEGHKNAFDDFALTAAHHWYDIEPVVNEAHETVWKKLRQAV